MQEFGLDMDPATHKTTYVTDIERSLFTSLALQEQRVYEQMREYDEAADCNVYTLEFIKKNV